MQARIESALTLEEVAEHFEHWRGNKRKGDRIPEQLWGEAVGLVSTYGVSQVARTLRLGGQDLNKRRGIIPSRGRKRAVGAEAAFVEIEPVVRDQTVGPERVAVWMELERGDGMRLRIRTAQGVDLRGVVASFVGTR